MMRRHSAQRQTTRRHWPAVASVPPQPGLVPQPAGSRRQRERAPIDCTVLAAAELVRRTEPLTRSTDGDALAPTDARTVGRTRACEAEK